MENERINYEKEYEELSKPKESGEYFKPKNGKYDLLILEEGVKTWYEASDGKKTEQMRLRIDFGGKMLDWFVTKGISFKSLYGQLVALAKEKGGLKGQRVTLLVKSGSKNKEGREINDYTILEAVGLQPVKEEKVV